jgi:hypothetical protein
MPIQIAELLVGESMSLLAPVVCGLVAAKIVDSRSETVQLHSIGEFWNMSNDPSFTQYSVEINGSLSKYAPFLLGPPMAKREIHRAYRRSIPEEDYKNIKTVIDAYLAYTAGQMVWRIDCNEAEYVFLGLYHSIVRNSIPVFVEKKYFYDKVDKLFKN